MRNQVIGAMIQGLGGAPSIHRIENGRPDPHFANYRVPRSAMFLNRSRLARSKDRASAGLVKRPSEPSPASATHFDATAARLNESAYGSNGCHEE